ncbi:unnamed protein product [Chilo suppressalis]|uniref:DUF4485 domain-containing protein n=1 Tax=Chilo suppressalis TaxID=168631 RepID=A0ABN8BAJ4_CHISP|nr:unnamed protein product [Chilo suppressalis]
MDENANLDNEFKRYLEIMRPYLTQIVDQDVINICKAWIQKLSDCEVNEKILRNKYVFALCYQLAKGMLQEPFLKFPEKGTLPPISDEFDSDISTTDAYLVMKPEDDTKVLFNNNDSQVSETDYLSQETDFLCESSGNKLINILPNQNRQNESCKQFIFSFSPDAMNINDNYKDYSEEYKLRANNLVLKLREIKTQNIILHEELEALKKECRKSPVEVEENKFKVDCCTSACCQSRDSNATLNSLKNKLQDVQESKNVMYQTIESISDKLKRFEDVKRLEIKEIETNHKLEIMRIETMIREETKEMYERKLDEMKVHYENLIEKIQNKLSQDKQDIITSKDEIIHEKEVCINTKDIEIARLKTLIEDEKNHLHDVINKFLEKPSEDLNIENMRIKAEQLEKRLNKVEKSKTKCTKVFEAKLAHLQREKHLAECSLQLQLVRQRAHVVNEVADESQMELNTALNKLESKYKDIVANMQTTAIQRRIQDRLALESILQAACGIQNDFTNCSQGPNHSQYSSKTMQNQNRNGNQINQSLDSELSALLHSNKVDNLIGAHEKSLTEGSVVTGYYLDGEKMGELLERVYIPQRDIGDGPLKK